MIMWFLSFLLLMWYVTLIDLHMLNHPYELGMDVICSWHVIFFMCYWVQFANILLSFLHLYINISKILVCNFLFWWYLWFWYQGDSGFIECLWECHLLFILLEVSERSFTDLSVFGRIWLWSHLVLDFCLLVVFILLLQILFHFQSLVCSNYLLIDSVLVGCMFLETCPFLLYCQIGWHIHSILLFFFFCISAVSVDIFYCTFVTLFICVLYLFFLMCLDRACSIWFILSKYQLLVLVIFFLLFFKNLFPLWFFNGGKIIQQQDPSFYWI